MEAGGLRFSLEGVGAPLALPAGPTPRSTTPGTGPIWAVSDFT